MNAVIFTDDLGVVTDDQRLTALANAYAERVAEDARRAVLDGPRTLQQAEREREASEAFYAAYAAATGVTPR